MTNNIPSLESFRNSRTIATSLDSMRSNFAATAARSNRRFIADDARDAEIRATAARDIMRDARYSR